MEISSNPDIKIKKGNHNSNNSKILVKGKIGSNPDIKINKATTTITSW